MPRKSGFTQNEAEIIHEQLRTIDSNLQKVSKTIVESYGWSSDIGRIAEGFLISSGTIRRTLSAINMELEEYTSSILGGASLIGAEAHSPSRLPHQMSLEVHEEVGKIMIESYSALIKLAVNTSNKVGKTKRLHKLIIKISQKISRMRDILDRRFVNEEHKVYSGANYKISPYYQPQMELN